MKPWRAAILAIGVMLPALAAAQVDGVSPKERAGPIPPPEAGAERIAVVGADDLIDRPLVARDRQPAGHIVHALIGWTSGVVSVGLVAGVPGLTLDGQVLALPWSKLTPSRGSLTLDLAMTSAELAAAPRIRDPRFTSGVRPEVTALIFDFADSSPSPPVDLGDPPPPPDLLVLPAGPKRTETAGPPVLISALELRGVAVAHQDGRPLGEIGQVLIDLEHRHVAYALIAEGGLRTPLAWLPVPIEVLVASGNGYALAAEDFWLRQVPPLSGPDSPGTVGSAWLKALYVNYGLRPYWQQVQP